MVRYSMLKVTATIALLGGPLCLLAQNVSLDANYGNVDLQAGFLPDPYTLALRAGGAANASSLGAGCVGAISDAPDLQLDFTAGSASLYISVLSEADTSLVVNTPDGRWVCDDDSGGNLNPALEFAGGQSGVFDIWVGSVGSSVLPEATLYLSEINQATALLEAGEVNLPPPGSRVEAGQLETSDRRLGDGSYVDDYSFTAQAGDAVVVDLVSRGFDSYLRLFAPSGELFSNDDYNGDTSRSLLSQTLGESGTWRVEVNSLYADETGSYTLTIDQESGGLAPLQQEYRGELAGTDPQRAGGQYMDVYEFQGQPGQRLTVDLSSEALDTYLLLETPQGSLLQNDDTDRIGHSVIETDLTEFGTYRVSASSYGERETGAYRLQISASGNGATGNDTVNLALGAGVAGRLQDGDADREEGQYQDYYSFQGTAGQTLRVSLQSAEFDTWLRVISPAGTELENDDFEGSTSLSQVEWRLPETGRYSVVVSSYRAGETGSYEVAVAESSVTADGGIRRVDEDSSVYGIFVGISDYSSLRRTQPGWGDLSYTREDALVIRDAMIAGAGMPAANAITLLDSDATVQNVRRAFSDLAARMDDDDTFVFFYSGHGGQEPRADGPNAADADGYDETLALADDTVTDDEISALFSSLSVETALIILDSCFSGGFAKDVISRPGRMGLFSSEEDVPSLVAGKFQAGGYLSHFFGEAISDGRADEDGDRAINAMELSQYLHARYSAERQTKSRSTFDTPNFGYQHLVADRGGVPFDRVLFRAR